MVDYSAALPYGLVVGLVAILLVLAALKVLEGQYPAAGLLLVLSLALGFLRDQLTVVIQPLLPVPPALAQGPNPALPLFLLIAAGLGALLAFVPHGRILSLFVLLSFGAAALEVGFIYAGFAPNIGKPGGWPA